MDSILFPVNYIMNPCSRSSDNKIYPDNPQATQSQLGTHVDVIF